MPDAGDVVWVNFPGAVTIKRRPAVVLSSDEYHSTRPDIILGLVTSQVAKIGAPSDHVLKDITAAGLRVSSVFRAFLVTLLKTAVLSTCGRLSAADWTAVRDCVQRAIAIKS